MERRKITDDLHALMAVLPPVIAQEVIATNDSDNLLEVILDLGRLPTARFIDREVVLRQVDVAHEDIDFVVQRIGEFDADNRAGLERTLHRISAIRNRRGHIVGLTCRVGRAVYGTTDIIKDLIDSGLSLLILGRPGVGKTTMLREAARILAENKRVVIVDTSNEIGGDGDVAHPAVGRARRMQVAQPSLQHEVMIEAVENHNPEAIVIDEIGRELEAEAARTIAERGVQLIGTAHGNTLENLLLNPTLSDLVGGIESVTLSDEEARRRGTQKTVLERRSPPTFDVLIEIQTRDRLAVHPDVAAAVDSLLRGYPLPPEIRSRVNGGEIRIERAPAPTRMQGFGQQGFRRQNGEAPTSGKQREAGEISVQTGAGEQADASRGYGEARSRRDRGALQTMRIYPYGVARNRLIQAARRLSVPAVIVNEAGEADVLVTLRSYYRNRQRTIVEAEHRNVPIYVLRANTVNQMQQFLGDLFNLYGNEAGEAGMEPILEETRAAISAVMNGERWIELHPAISSVRRVQHQMAREANLTSHSYGREPNRRVRIFRANRNYRPAGEPIVFITFEGPEGGGKTTQMSSLLEFLRQQGIEVIATREPGGTPIGEQIRTVLHDLRNQAMQPRAELLLFQASRAQLVDQVIRPTLESGGVVICDRYGDSTVAYQGYGHQQFELSQVRQLVEFATGGLKPDLTLLLDVDTEEGLERKVREGEWNRLDAYALDFHRRVRQGYLELAREDPQRWVIINASQPYEVVQDEIRRVVLSRLGK